MSAVPYISTNDYSGLKDYILRGKSKTERKVANNTTARLEGDAIIVKYHESDIVELTKDTIKLDSCGYKTPTTKERLNWYTPEPFCLEQKLHIWYIRNRRTNEEYIFKNGITFLRKVKQFSISWNVDVNTCGKDGDVKKINALKAKIKTYVNNYVDELMKGKIGAPDGGDCWYCYFQTEGENISLGEKVKDTSHLEDHFKERYYVPSLLMNAIRAFPISQFAQGILYELWYDKDGKKHDYSWGLDIFQSQVKSSLIRFLYRQFNIA